MPRLSVLTASLALAAMASSAMAALPHGTLEFVQRTGTVSASDTIAVVMRLTLADDSAPLTFSSNPLTGFAPEDLPTQGQRYMPDGSLSAYRDFVRVNEALLGTYYACVGDFTGGCNKGSNYTFEFNSGDSGGGPSLDFVKSFELAAGQSFDYTFGYFTPKAGGAAPGVYRWNGTGITLNFLGVDADGHTLLAYNVLVDTGYSLDPGVAFERTVLAVPEPGSYALMFTGLAALGGFARRRSSSSH